MLEELEAAGIPPERVTVLIGTGSHRPNTPDELRDLLASFGHVRMRVSAERAGCRQSRTWKDMAEGFSFGQQRTGAFIVA